MKEKLLAYLQDPTRENFLSLRKAVLSADKFNPYSDELDGVSALMEAGDFEGVIGKTMRHLWPNHLLSPGAHMNLSFAHHKLGREKEAQAEWMVGTLLMRGIEQTGDGTPEKPFLVSRTSDEYDYLEAHQLEPESQALVRKDGSSFDVLTLKSGAEVWFDITEIMQLLERRMGDGIPEES